MNEINLGSLKNYKSYLVLSLAFCALCVLFSTNMIVLITISVFAIAVYLIKEDIILPLSIFLFLILTGHEVEKYRTIGNIIIILTVGLIFLKKYGLKFNSYPKVPIQIVSFVIFLTVTLVISSSLSIAPFITYLSTLRLLLFFLLCYFFYSSIQNEKTVDSYLLAIFLSVIVVGISILFEIYKTGFVLFLISGSIVRYGGIYDNPNYVGLLLLITIPINVALFFRFYKNPNSTKFVLLLILLISIILLFVTNSRSSIIGATLASSITLAIINKKVFVKFFSILILCLIVLSFITEVQEFLSLYFRIDRVGNREYFWNAGLAIISDYPYFGVGPELFDTYYFTYVSSLASGLYESGAWLVGRPHPHNFFLLFAAENGILGIISAIYFFILFFYFCIKTLLLIRNKMLKDYLIVASALGIGVGILFRAFFEVTGIITYGFITRDLPFWIIFIIVIYFHRKHSLEVIIK